ncbi:uncharacterized protein LOC123690940 [Colias croceus]|uniref:uncharacterized protein LOC123690940 n=1 Tax=Colias crocea TaxID=72248 RepID=UPI001E281A3F|nr:uncharacterized protein LOC123690940 [Colias croceus]
MTEQKFKTFHETFRQCAFALAFALIYPNISNYRKRAILFYSVVGVNSLMLYWFFLYLYKCTVTQDLVNLTRNISIGILTSLFFFKYFYVNSKIEIFAQLLQKITDDLLKGNELEEDYQEIYEQYIKIGKLGQFCWIVIPLLLSTQFPMYASVATIYESLKSDVGKRYMVHELEIKNLEDKQFETPLFEFVFGYNIVQCITLCPNFVGFDGSFCIATTHLCMKLKLVSHKMYRAFKDSKDRDELKIRVKEAIKDHQEALDFYNDLQEFYGGWLFMVFLVTSLLIAMNLYQLYLSDHIDVKYTIFAISAATHMFTPCYFASNLIKASEDLSLDIYAVEWEHWADPQITNLLIFMIAKSQQILLLHGKGMVYFNMNLFISLPIAPTIAKVSADPGAAFPRCSQRVGGVPLPAPFTFDRGAADAQPMTARPEPAKGFIYKWNSHCQIATSQNIG